jgi:hypothetical protein
MPTCSFYTGLAVSENISKHMTEFFVLKYIQIYFEYYLSILAKNKDFPL